MVILHSRGPSVFVHNDETNWPTRLNDKILEVISHFVSVQSNSVALEGSCQSMVKPADTNSVHHKINFIVLQIYILT